MSWQGQEGEDAALGEEKGAQGPVSAFFPHLLTGSALLLFSVPALGTDLERDTPGLQYNLSHERAVRPWGGHFMSLSL